MIIPEMEGSGTAEFSKRSRISSECIGLEMEKDERTGGGKEREIEIRRGRSREKHETHEPRFQKKRFFINNNC